MISRASKFERPVRKLAYVAGLLGPLSAIPQVVVVWSSHQTSGVSLVSQVLCLMLAMVWLAYGSVVRDRPIFISSCLWVILDLAIITGVLRNAHL